MDLLPTVKKLWVVSGFWVHLVSTPVLTELVSQLIEFVPWIQLPGEIEKAALSGSHCLSSFVSAPSRPAHHTLTTQVTYDP